MSPRQRRLEIILFVLIILAGVVLRFYDLGSIPPGLTHDEADHALDASKVLEGITPIYFTVGYGREPFYDYTTALTMLVVGKNYLASRITAALFGTLLLVVTYAFVRKASGNVWLALATIAGLAVSFWAVSQSRSALRSITMPVLFMASALAMWHGFDVRQHNVNEKLFVTMRHWGWFVLSGLLLGISGYTYLSARVTWIVFPAFFLLMLVTQRGVILKVWPGILITLAVAAVVASPLAYYLYTHPLAEVRIGQLSYPLDELRAGNPAPLTTNVLAGLGMIALKGDSLWLYNLPGRPLLMPAMAVLFLPGLIITLVDVIVPYRAVDRRRRTYLEAFQYSSTALFMLLLLGAGLFPALIVGIDGSNTRTIGMMPALYYFPALAVTRFAEWTQSRFGDRGAIATWSAYILLILASTALTIYAYFNVWANERNVRVAYHTTLIETLNYIDAHPDVGPDIALSSITPGPFHDAAVAEVYLKRDDVNLRWFDGRTSLLVPNGSDGAWVFPEITALNDKIVWWMANRNYDIETIELRSNDFNRTVEIVQWQQQNSVFNSTIDHIEPATLDGIVTLFNYMVIPKGQALPGDTISVLTWWRIEETTNQELVFFTHAIDGSGQLAAQQDLLGVPTTSWQQGDVFLQLHELTLPADMPSGDISLVVGAYTIPDIVRLLTYSKDGSLIGDGVTISTISVVSR